MAQQSESDSTKTGSIAERQRASQFVGFQIDGQNYAFPIGKIQEIVILDQITVTPQVAEYVEGVSNLRGSIIPVINLRKLMGLQPKPADEQTRTIVVNVGSRTVGCTVDTVSQVIRIVADDIQPVPDTLTSGGADYISGFVKVEEELVILLDSDELLDPEKLQFIRDTREK